MERGHTLRICEDRLVQVAAFGDSYVSFDRVHDSWPSLLLVIFEDGAIFAIVAQGCTNTQRLEIVAKKKKSRDARLQAWRRLEVNLGFSRRESCASARSAGASASALAELICTVSVTVLGDETV